MKRIIWISENGKYKILARKFEDGTTHVNCWKINRFGKNADVRKKVLPVYVQEQMKLMRKQVIGEEKNELT